ncbi:MAG: hypothetical protein QOH60_3511 [Mycobacterium sp.]|jgi:hypothetical protein|nr:hypothetical protein [Mycobacterium sp.]
MDDTVTADAWSAANWSYAAVMDMQARLDPVRMTRYADDWQRAIDRIEEVLGELKQRVGAQLHTSWRGDGADASAKALQRYLDGSLAGLAACRSVAERLSELSSAAGDLRAASGGFAADALDDALAQVRQRYSGPAVAAGNSVEDIPAPPDPFTRPDRSPTSALPVVAPLQPPSAAQPMGSTLSPPAVPAPNPAAHTPNPAVHAANPAWHAANPAWHTPNAVWHTPTHTTAIPGGPPLSPDPPAIAPGPPAQGVPGSAGPPVTAPRGLAPPPFASYFPGMYPGHMGRDSGSEHRIPSYLVSAGNTSELIGELPLVAPPVIGE